jgi:hypothetical protein
VNLFQNYDPKAPGNAELDLTAAVQVTMFGTSLDDNTLILEHAYNFKINWTTEKSFKVYKASTSSIGVCQATAFEALAATVVEDIGLEL